VISLSIESLDAAGFLRKIAVYDADLRAKQRSELDRTRKQRLESYENQFVSLTGWLVLSYASRAETTNCDATFHDWHLEISENPGDHRPQIGGSTPIICEITPRTEKPLYDQGVRIQALAGFLRLPDNSYRPTGHPARKVRVTGYLMWDDVHNGKADVGSKTQCFGRDKIHHPWRSTAWEVHPVVEIEVLPAANR
jgi:hypothetical protein